MTETPPPSCAAVDDDGRVSGTDSSADAEVDTGQPIAELANLRHSPEKGFFGRVRRRIERRELGTQVIELGWHGPILVFVEWLDALFGSLRESRPTSADEKDES